MSLTLPQLQGLGAGASSTGTVTPEAATGAGSAVANALTGGAYSGFSGFVSWLQSGKGIAVIIGVILIIAGLFQFRSVREVVGYSAKGAALAA